MHLLKYYIKIIIVALIILLFSIIYIFKLGNINEIDEARRFCYIFLSNCILATTIFYLFFQKKIVLKFNYIDVFFLLYFIYTTIRFFLIDRYVTLNENFEQLLSYIFFYFIIKFLYKNNSNFIPILNLIIQFSGLFQIFFGYFQLIKLVHVYNNYFKITGTFTNPSPYSYYVAIIFIHSFGVLLLFYKKNKNIFLKKLTFVLSLSICISALIILPFTQSRTSWIMAITGIIIIIYFRFNLKKYLLNLYKNWIYKCIVFISLAIITIFLTNILYKFKPQSADGRLLIWKVSIQIAKDNPLFGVGYNQFSNSYNIYLANWFLLHPKAEYEKKLADSINYTYNELYQILIENGLIGLFLFILLLITVQIYIIRIYRYKKDIGVLIFSLWSCILVCSMFSYPFRIISFNLIFILLLAIISNESDSDFIQINVFNFKKIVMLFICISYLLTSSFEEVNRFKGYNLWYSIQNNTKINNEIFFDKMYAYAYPYLKQNGEFLCDYANFLECRGKIFESLKMLILAKRYCANSYLYYTFGNVYNDLNDFKNAEKSYITSINMTPKKLTHRVSLLRLYEKYGYIQKAKEMANEILSTETKEKTFYIRMYKSEAQRVIKKYIQ
jgi:O-antigen polymerase